MKISVFAARTVVRRQLLATTMFAVIGLGAALHGPRALAQTADQPPAEGGETIPCPRSRSLERGPAPDQARVAQPASRNSRSASRCRKISPPSSRRSRRKKSGRTSTSSLPPTRSNICRASTCGRATKAPMIGFRTTSQDTPAQSLIYADGILLSNLLGNYYFYAPVTQMVTPNEISRADVIYGPFSALYPGNSSGGIVTFSTRMPDQFEAHLAAKGFDQRFDLYKSDGWFPGDNFSVAIGNRYNAFSFWLTYDHVTAPSQPFNSPMFQHKRPSPSLKAFLSLAAFRTLSLTARPAFSSAPAPYAPTGSRQTQARL
jgi:TonB-dependent Receptor Plug Domain